MATELLVLATFCQVTKSFVGSKMTELIPALTDLFFGHVQSFECVRVPADMIKKTLGQSPSARSKELSLKRN